MIQDYLKRGKENKVSFAELQELTGIYNTRQLRKAIAEERKDGALILSTSTGGYYLPANEAEIEEYVKFRSKEAYATFRALKPATRALKADLDQITFEGSEETC